MEEKNDLKKIYEKLARGDIGRMRGEAIINRLEYIRRRQGEKGVRAVGAELKKSGCPMELDKIESLSWYPEVYGIIIILAARRIFGWNDADIFAMGENAPKISFLVKLLMKYFVSVEKTFSASPGNWKKHHSAGTLEPADFDEKNKRLTLRLKGYRTHPAMCVFLRGYFTQFAKMVVKSEEVEVRETKCMFRGADYHEFLITWK